MFDTGSNEAGRELPGLLATLLIRCGTGRAMFKYGGRLVVRHRDTRWQDATKQGRATGLPTGRFASVQSPLLAAFGTREIVLQALMEKEIALHTYEVRSDPRRLRELLHTDFIEIGYSGETYTLDRVLVSLPRKTCQNHRIWSQDFEYHRLSQDAYLLVYKSANLNPSGKLFRHAKRSSIWIDAKMGWQLRFHQATPVEEFEQAHA